MTGHPNHVADDQDEFWDFDPKEERMTMTVDPATHYAELAALASLIRWADRVDESCSVDFLTDDELPMYVAAARLREAYGRDQF